MGGDSGPVAGTRLESDKSGNRLTTTYPGNLLATSAYDKMNGPLWLQLEEDERGVLRGAQFAAGDVPGVRAVGFAAV